MSQPDQVAVAIEPAPVIWNPNAAANWSLLFSPAFGSYLNMLNWRALGESEREASSRKWFYASLGMLVFYVLLAVLIGDSAAVAGMTRLAGFVYLLTWYISSARSQAKYVKERFGNDYTRRSWGKAFAYAVGGVIGYLVFSFMVGMVAAILL